MAGIIFVIFIWIMVIAVKKGKSAAASENTQRSDSTPSTPVEKPVQVQRWMTAQEKQQETKARLEAKYKAVPKPARESEILKRAMASVNEDFSKNVTDEKEEESNSKNWEAINKQKEIERRVAAKLASEEEIEADKQQQYHLIQTVEDLMIKGPNTELAFERDFLAEGMDMLNKIQM